jgi:hypothetical protein
MRRRVALLLAFVGVVLVTGCLSPLPQEGEVDYGDRWNTTDDVTYFLGDETFTAVVRTDGIEGDEVEVWERDPFGGTNPVTLAEVRFRNADGDVTEVSDEEVDTSGDRTVVTLPEGDGGRLAYVAEKGPQKFTQPSPVAGSVGVHLPEGTDARNFFLGRISPGDYTAASEDPLVLRWDELESGTFVTVEYYREGYPLVLVGAIVVLTLAAGVVVYIYRRRLKETEEKQREP